MKKIFCIAVILIFVGGSVLYAQPEGEGDTISIQFDQPTIDLNETVAKKKLSALRLNVISKDYVHRLSAVTGSFIDINEKIRRFNENKDSFQDLSETPIAIFVEKAANISSLVEVARDVLDQGLVDYVYVYCLIDKGAVEEYLQTTVLPPETIPDVAQEIADIATTDPDVLASEVEFADTIQNIASLLILRDAFLISKKIRESSFQPYVEFTAQDRSGRRVRADQVKAGSYVFVNSQYNFDQDQVRDLITNQTRHIVFDDSFFRKTTKIPKVEQITIANDIRKIIVHPSIRYVDRFALENIVSKVEDTLAVKIYFMELDPRAGKHITVTDYGRTLAVSREIMEDPDLIIPEFIVQIPSRAQFEKDRTEFPAMTSVTDPAQHFMVEMGTYMQEIDVSLYNTERKIIIGQQQIEIKGEDVSARTVIDIMGSLESKDMETLREIEVFSTDKIDLRTGRKVIALRIRTEKRSYRALAKASRIFEDTRDMNIPSLFTLVQIDLPGEDGTDYKSVWIDKRLVSEDNMEEEVVEKGVVVRHVRKKYVSEDNVIQQAVPIDDPALVEREIVSYIKRRMDSGIDVHYVTFDLGFVSAPQRILVTADENGKNKVLLFSPDFVEDFVESAIQRREEEMSRENIEDPIGVRREIFKEKGHPIIEALGSVIDKSVDWLRDKKKGVQKWHEYRSLKSLDEPLPVARYAFSFQRLFQRRNFKDEKTPFQIQELPSLGISKE